MSRCNNDLVAIDNWAKNCIQILSEKQKSTMRSANSNYGLPLPSDIVESAYEFTAPKPKNAFGAGAMRVTFLRYIRA